MLDQSIAILGGGNLGYFMQDLACDLVGNAVKVKYNDLPKDVVEITKKFILDMLATTVAGSSAYGCKTVVDQIKEWGGKEESTILVYGGKVPSLNAAFTNSMMAHALDFDDIHVEASLHATPSVVPAAMAMAERIGNVSGKDFITAVAVGADLLCRIGLGVPPGPLKWILTSTAGYFGATVATGKLIDLDESKLLHALGIAYSQCAGSAQCRVDGGLVKRMQPAFAARGGVISSLLAQKGITGAKNIFEGRFGFFPLYYRGEYTREKVIEGLGEVFEIKNLSVKPYPCCNFTHASIDATLSIVEENDIRPDDVAEVIAHITEEAYSSVGKPFEIRESPQVDAQFSIPYTVSVAIVRRDVCIDDFFEERIRTDKQVLQLTKKVKVIVDQKPTAVSRTPILLDIKTKDGETYSRNVEIVRGDPRKPIGIEEVAQKFRKCAAYSAKPISEKKIEELIRVVKNLETITDVASVFNMALELCK